MAERARNPELGRGERVERGVFRLRLPLPWPGVPHCNSWAVQSGDGVVLFDTGMHQPDSMAQLERAMAMCGLRVEQVVLVVCTHAHLDHCGQAGEIVARAGCELWMHPNHDGLRRMISDPQAVLGRQLEVARQSGVPEAALRRYAAERSSGDLEVFPVPEPDRALVDGVTVDTDLGTWTTYETPGHAPSHVCLYQPEHRLLISGDHLLGRISLYFDYGSAPDPVGEYLRSLDLVAGLNARLCLPGHGRTFTDVRAHIDASRTLVDQRLAAVAEAIALEPLSPFEIVPRVYGEAVTQANAHWLLSKILCYLAHLHTAGLAYVIAGEPERWLGSDRPVAPAAAEADQAGAETHAGAAKP